MTATVSQPSGTAPASEPGRQVVVKRIRFVDRAPADAKVRRAFDEPRPCVAVEEHVEPGACQAADGGPEPTDSFDLLLAPNGAPPECRTSGDGWQAPPDHPEVAPAALVERDCYTVQWRPGRAVVQGRVDDPEAVLAGLTDFAFYEGELRTLEHALEACAAGARADVARAYRIRFRDREHWARFGERIELLAGMRLRYASLEPRLAKPSRALPAESRRVMARLLARADVKARLEALTNRLEACEDLYEGANDRVTDHRWYLEGHALEIGIILLLVGEVFIMAADLAVHVFGNHGM
jgi:hypothetical protein